MKIPEFGTLQMVRTNEQHYGTGKITSLDKASPVNGIKSGKVSAVKTQSVSGKSFEDYLLEAVNTVNNNQLDVNAVQEKLITNPDEVDIHDVTIAMSKARMSLNLAQNVIDRLTTSWNEITTTR